MLVLSRKAGEQIIIGDNICVTVVAVRGNQVRIGINAPGEISIVREELFEPPAFGAGPVVDAPLPDRSALQ